MEGTFLLSTYAVDLIYLQCTKPKQREEQTKLIGWDWDGDR